mgnify:CR=1 FL=1
MLKTDRPQSLREIRQVAGAVEQSQVLVSSIQLLVPHAQRRLVAIGDQNFIERVTEPSAGLLADFQKRDMLKDTLVMWGGEFGRTSHVQTSDGRDHNIRATPYGWRVAV